MSFFLSLLILWNAAASISAVLPCDSLYGAAGGGHLIHQASWPEREHLRVLEPTQLTNLRPPEVAGVGANHMKLYVGNLESESVFIKVSFAKTNTTMGYKMFEKEAQWSKWMSDLGIGPKFKGIVKLEDGYSIVTENFPGAHIDELSAFASQSGAINENTVRDLERIRATFAANKILPMDFHFRMSPEGRVVVIDPAFYLLKGRDVPAAFPGDGLGPLDAYLTFAKEKLAQGQP